MNFINNTGHNTSDLANLALSFANLSAEDRKIVKICIDNYAERKGIIGVVSEWLYNVLEAYKGRSNSSDWQKAQKVFENKVFSSILPKFSRRLIGEERIHAASDKALRGLVCLNNKNSVRLPRKLEPIVAKNCNVDIVVKQIIDLAQKIGGSKQSRSLESLARSCAEQAIGRFIPTVM